MNNKQVFTAIGAVGLALLIGFQLGKENALNEVPNAFVPRFVDEHGEDYWCLATVERRGTRTVYAGCFAPHILERVKNEYAKSGIRTPFRVIGEFDREIDDL